MLKYKIREASQADIHGITLLRHTIKEFRPISTEEYRGFWNSVINSNPCSGRQVLVALSEQGEIVAHYAIMPFRFSRDGEIQRGGFLCQLMVHEKYRNELIFPRMELKFLKDYRGLGYDFLFSLGNRKKVVKAHLSFGFQKMGELPVYARPYRLARIARQHIKSGLLNALLSPAFFMAERLLRFNRTFGGRDVETAEIPEFGQDIDLLMKETQAHFPYSAVRDSATLNWRFRGYADVKYRILVARENGKLTGYAVLRRMEMNRFDVLAVVDILFPPDRISAGKALLNAVHRMARQLNVEMSACLLNSGDPLCPVLKKCGYFKTPETFSLFVHEPKDASPHFSEGSFNKWHMTWFDNDAV